VVSPRAGDDGSRLLLRLMGSLQSVLRRRSAAVAAMWAAAGALAALVGLLAIDGAGGVPHSARALVYGVTGAAGVAVVACAALVAWGRKPSSAYVARLIEDARPELKNALLTFVELASEASSDPSMTEAVGRRAAAILARDGPGRFLPPWDVRRPLVAVLGAGALVGAMLWLAQGTRVRPWVASADAGLIGADLMASGPGVDSPAPAASEAAKPSRSGGPERAATQAAEPRPAEAGGAAKTAAPKPSPGDGAAEAAMAEALGPALRADAETFERLAAALAAGGTPAAHGDGAGSGHIGTGHAGAGTGRGGLGESLRDGPVSRRADAASAGDDTDPSPRPDGTGAAEPSADGGGAAGPNGSDPHAAGGAAQTEPRRAAKDSPLPDREPSDAFPKNALDAMRRAKRLIEEADRRLRDGEVADVFLGRMGVGNAEFRRFVVAWQRRFEAAAGGPAVTPRPGRIRSEVGTPKVEVLRPTGGREATPIVGRVNVGPDGGKGSVQGAASGVSSRLRPAVRAYFEAIDQLTTEPREKDGLK